MCPVSSQWMMLSLRTSYTRVTPNNASTHGKEPILKMKMDIKLLDQVHQGRVNSWHRA